MTKHNRFFASAAFAAISLVGIASANAAPFGPATASVGSFDVPTVTASTITLNGGIDQLSAGTGTLVGTPFFGSGSGTFNYSQTNGSAPIANVLASLFTFNDKFGGNYVFDLASVQTINFSMTGTSETIALFLLGQMSDTNLGLTATPTSITMTFNSTNGSAFSESGSLSNPPAPLPEPVSMTLLVVGMAGLGLIRHRRG